MPLLNVAVAGKPDAKRSLKIATKLTELTNQHLGKDPALTAVKVEHVDPDHWFVGGQALSKQTMSERNAASFSLHISITEGTNTKPQIAMYIDAVFSQMSDSLGAVREESYIVVDEVPAPAWGYAGKTQEFRYIAGQLSAATGDS